MKIFNFLIFLTTTTTILVVLPFLVMAQEPDNESFLNCSWFNVVDFQGNEPTSTTDFWNFKNATCSSAVVEKINDATSSFFLIKSWDYGELLMAFLMILFFFLVIFILIFNFFFEPVFKIRGKQ
jgi:hypothetical protein